MTLEQLITAMAPRQGRNIGWVQLRKALRLLNTNTTTVEKSFKPIKIELTSVTGLSVDYEFDEPFEDANYIISNKWGDMVSGKTIVNITNKTKDGFTASSQRFCVLESVAYKL